MLYGPRILHMVKPPGYNSPPCDMHPSKAPTSGIASATLEQICNLQTVKLEFAICRN